MHCSHSVSLVECLRRALLVEALERLTVVSVASRAIRLPKTQLSVLSHCLRLVLEVQLQHAIGDQYPGQPASEMQSASGTGSPFPVGIVADDGTSVGGRHTT